LLWHGTRDSGRDGNRAGDIRLNTLEIANLSAWRSWLGGGVRHYPDLLREGDEARVVLVGEQERILQQLDHTGIVRGPTVLQSFEHLLRLLAQGIDLGDLTAAAVRVFVDEFFQRRVGLPPPALGIVSQRQCIGAPERIGFPFGQFHRRAGIAAQDLPATCSLRRPAAAA
jgi:hypothetical protein